MTVHVAAADGVSLAVDEHGIGRGPPAVVLHGFAGSAATVGELIEPLVRAGHRVLTPDLVGHGRSSCPQRVELYRMEACVEQLEQMCRELAVEAATVVGYSMGGRVALQWATAHPDRFRRLITIGATPGLAADGERAERAAADEALAARIEAEGIAWFDGYWSDRPIFATQRERLGAGRRAEMAAVRLGQQPVGLANSLRAMGTGAMPWVSGADLATVTAPALVLAGGDDEKFCAIGNRLAAQLGAGRFEAVPHAGHAAHLEQPDRVGRLIRRFLDRS